MRHFLKAAAKSETIDGGIGIARVDIKLAISRIVRGDRVFSQNTGLFEHAIPGKHILKGYAGRSIAVYSKYGLHYIGLPVRAVAFISTIAVELSLNFRLAL